MEIEHVRPDVGTVIGVTAPDFEAELLRAVRDAVQNAAVTLVLVAVIVAAAAIGVRAQTSSESVGP